MPNPFKAKSKIDTCHICLETKVLTNDHVPPSGTIGGRHPTVSWRPMDAERVGRDPREPLTFKSKTGLNFPTVCLDCHQTISHFDEQLKLLTTCGRFASRLRGIGDLAVRVSEDAIVRATLFHMLTARFAPSHSKPETFMRSVVKGNTLPDDCEMYLYLWLYGGPLTAYIMQEFLALYPGAGNTGLRSDLRFGNILKFGGLAFFAVDKQIRLLTGSDVRKAITDPAGTVIINTAPGVSDLWPEDSPFRMGGRDMTQNISAVATKLDHSSNIRKR